MGVAVSNFCVEEVVFLFSRSLVDAVSYALALHGPGAFRPQANPLPAAKNEMESGATFLVYSPDCFLVPSHEDFSDGAIV
ncbi:hypothetical protein B0G73_10111 [Paraburkholderia sp. BL25I1N1]|nr:hypothetical protein B0G73_10111 [Paraburkholderia sp. BL25I1N1]